MPVSSDGDPSPQKVVQKALFDNSPAKRKYAKMAENKQCQPLSPYYSIV
jgi:hypothetical protein